MCYRLWQFLESYDEVGYSIEERDTPLEFDEEYQIQLFSNLITNYTVFKSLLEADPRKLSEIPPKRKKITKPKFIKKIQEEIVTDYNIPDVEVRKVIIEEVTQAQLDAEAKLAEETARREELEAQLADSEKAFQEYRWQAEFQRAEAERQAEDRLEFTKQKAEKEKQELLSTLEKEKQNAAEALTKEQEKAARKEAQWNAAMEKAAQAAADALNQEKERASRREAELNAAMETQRQAAAKTLAEAQEETTRQADAHHAAMEAEKKAAGEKSEKSKQTLDFVKKTLGDKVKYVRLSDNLGSHPVSVVPAEGMTFEMEKYFKRVDPNSGMKADRILEFNADHPIFAKLQIAVAQDEKKAEDLVKILYTQALLMADLPVENAGEYTDLVCSLIG